LLWETGRSVKPGWLARERDEHAGVISSITPPFMFLFSHYVFDKNHDIFSPISHIF
jgi:hypothetical protein